MPTGASVRSKRASRDELREDSAWQFPGRLGSARVSGLLTVLLAVLAPTLGGSTEPWSEGVILFLLGVGLLIAPPRRAPHRFAWPAFLAALLLAAAAFFPIGDWSHSPVPDKLEQLQIPRGITMTWQPWLTLEAVVLMTAGIAWWWWVAAAPSPHSRARLVRWITGGITALAVLSLAMKAGWISVPFWPGFAPLGPFPNKNQMGNLLGTWAIVATAAVVEGFRMRKASGFGWLAALAALLVALIGTQSRGGVLVFVAGSLCWGIWESARRQRYREIGITLAVALCGAAAFFATGGDAFHKLVRLLSLQGDSAAVVDFRLPIFRDTWNLINEAPLTGIGLANFESAFAFYRDASVVSARVLHPESDWLWLVSELGWLALPICGVLLLPGVASIRRLGADDAVMRAASVAGLMFLLHGFIDVAGHRLGSALPGIFLLGIGMAPVSAGKESRITRSAFRSLALLLGCAGAWFVAGSLNATWVLPGTHGVERKTQDARASIAREEFAKARDTATEGLRWAPLDWELYSLRATAHCYEGDFDSAHRDFRRARALEPTNAGIAWQEGALWAYFDASSSEEAWKAALQRSGADAGEIYGKMLTEGAAMPGMLPVLEQLAGSNPLLRIRYLQALSPDVLKNELPAWLEESRIASLPATEQRMYFELWRRVPATTPLERWLTAHPDYIPATWRVIADRYAADGNFKDAVELALKHLPPPPLPRFDRQPLADSLREFYRNPADLAAGYRTYQAQREAGMIEDALTTLHKLSASPTPPPYLPYLRAATLAEARQWEEAWREIVGYRP